MVYVTAVGTGATMYAVHAATGTVTWRQKILGGNQSSPAVTTEGIYVSYSCQYTYRLALRTGATTWKYAPSCYGGGGRTAVVAAGSLWVRDAQRQYPATALSLTDGTPRGTFSMNHDDMRAPTFLGRTGFFVANGMLQARSTQIPNKSLWTFLDNRRITSAPIVVNGYVYAGSEDGHIYAINPATGRTVWSAPLGAPVQPPDEHNLSEPLTGLAAGQGILAVPATNLLVAYGK
jgi:outer membrane protein assembly factor BamB